MEASNEMNFTVAKEVLYPHSFWFVCLSLSYSGFFKDSLRDWGKITKCASFSVNSLDSGQIRGTPCNDLWLMKFKMGIAKAWWSYDILGCANRCPTGVRHVSAAAQYRQTKHSPCGEVRSVGRSVTAADKRSERFSRTLSRLSNRASTTSATTTRPSRLPLWTNWRRRA